MRRAFTLAETLVSVAVMGVLSLALVMIYDVTNTVLDQGSGRIQLQQRTRETMRRIAPLLSAAIPPVEDKDAIRVPALNTTASAVDFYTTQDVMGGTTFDPRAPVYVQCRIGMTAGGDVMLWQLDSANNPVTSPAPRVLSRGLTGFSVTRVSLDGVKIQLTAQTTVRNARAVKRVIDYTFSGMLQIPYYSVHQ